MRPTKPPATRHSTTSTILDTTNDNYHPQQPQYRPMIHQQQQQTQQQSSARPQIPPMHTQQPSQVPQGMYTQPTAVQYYVPQFAQTGRLPAHVMYLVKHTFTYNTHCVCACAWIYHIFILSFIH